MSRSPFDPPLLPPNVDYGKLVTEIAKANAAVARLDAFLLQLKNPRLLQRTLVTREAVLSSRIEGTEVTLQEVLEQDAKEISTEDTDQEKDYREVTNYRKALERGVELLAERPLGENVIKELHSILLRSARGQHRGPGEFRKTLVYIAKPGAGIEEASYIPPLPSEFPRLLSNFEQYIHSEQRETLIQIGVAHYQFEAIHPFEDGNGRIGRLLISLMLHEKKLLSHPFIYLSEFFEEHRREYYDLLKGVSEKEDWESWLAFFLRGIAVQAQNTQETASRILDLRQALNTQVGALNSRYAHEFLDALFVNPYFSSATIRRRSGIQNQQTLFTLIAKFRKAGIISDFTPHKRRNKIYRFDRLTQLLDG